MFNSDQKQSSFRTVTEWLGQHPKQAHLLQQVQQNIALSKDLEAVLGARLAKQCQILKVEQQTLYVATSSQACAAKIQHLLPSLLRHYQDKQHSITNIQVKVLKQENDSLSRHADKKLTPDSAVAASSTKRLSQSAPSGGAKAACEALQKQLKPGPLADHIARLLERWQ
ncbi:DciA family protein [Brackiella oedipodis]|uniref:DciA family protein n=1 Tax=Brackiella oedipodis TaxID=124225 RepID=UPI00048BDFFE|nr:DciA family protein [Brackiella oedipodis]